MSAGSGGDVLAALGDGIAVDVIQRRREIAVVDDEGVAGSAHLLGHLVDNGDKCILEHLEGDWVEGEATAYAWAGIAHLEFQRRMFGY